MELGTAGFKGEGARAGVREALWKAQAGVRRELLVRLVLVCLFLSMLTNIALVSAAGHQPTRLLGPSGLIITSLGALLCLRKGWVEASVRWFLAGAWLSVLLGVVVNGGVHAPAVYAFVLVVLGAGAFYGVRWATGVSGLTIATLACLPAVEWAGWLPPAPGSVPGIVPIVLVGCLMMAILVVTSEHVKLLTSIIEDVVDSHERIEASEGRVRRLLDAAGFPLLLVDARGAVIEENSRFEQVFGHGRRDFSTLAEWGVLAFPDPEYRRARFEPWVAAVTRAAAGGGAVETGEYHVTCKAGNVLEVVISSRAVDEGVLVTFVDITERRRAEEALRHREKMDAIGQLAGGIAHDFNNQLAGIIGYAELLKLWTNDRKLTGCAESILKASQRGADLTRQLLAFSRKGNYLSVPLDVHATITEVAALLGRSIDRRIEIRLELDATPSIVIGDPAQLQSAILNLGLNAKDAMPSGGELLMATRLEILAEGALNGEVAPGRHVEIQVRDTGCGMSDDVKQHLFEPFFTTKPMGQGTGLGLASVFGTVKSHRGTVTVESTVGAGTTVRVYLPLHEQAVSETPRASVDPEPSGDCARLVVVDDDELVCELTREQLEALGYAVTCFVDPHDALTHYQEASSTTDLVLLDMMMPKMSGFDLFLAMRRVNPQVRAVLVSGYSIQGEAQDALDKGALGFIQKPFDRATLAASVEAALKAPLRTSLQP